MCVTNANDMSNTNTDDGKLRAQVAQDNKFFKDLLDLIPPSAYFSIEEKNELLGKKIADEDEDEAESIAAWKKQKHKMRGAMNPLASMSISQITQQMQGKKLAANDKHQKKNKEGEEAVNGQSTSLADQVDAKHKAKKMSRNPKANKKNKGVELQKKEARLLELHHRLQAKIEALKARKNSGKQVTSNEQKRLRKQEKKVSNKLKKTKGGAGKALKNQMAKENRTIRPEGLRSPPQNQVLNENGDPVKSKFDFSMFSTGNDKSRKGDFQGKDYKRLLEKVTKRQEQVKELKEKDSEKGKELEEKLAWQSTISRAKGEKVKDDPQMLKKAMKRKEKMKEVRKKKMDQRAETVEKMKDKRQQKRQANLDKRKNDKTDKKRKKMIKKGRIIPGF